MADCVPLLPEHADDLHAVTHDLNDEGFRVIAVAYKTLPPGPATYTVADEADMILLKDTSRSSTRRRNPRRRRSGSSRDYGVVVRC